jgi:hypothetical protein
MGGMGIGKFQAQLADFTEPLAEVIKGFHNIKHRFVQWDEAIAQDAAGRVAQLATEIEWIESRREEMLAFWAKVESGEIPMRVTHNDTKINNVLFDAKTGEGKTVIDLDTVMPGLVAYDFGDAIRFAGNRSAEDEKDTSLTWLDLDRFSAFTRGFVGELAHTLTENERKTLSLGVFVMTVELAVRFLDDYICGDVYFKLLYPEHNLVRTRCQLALARDIETKLGEMDRIVDAIYVESLAKC